MALPISYVVVLCPYIYCFKTKLNATKMSEIVCEGDQVIK